MGSFFSQFPTTFKRLRWLYVSRPQKVRRAMVLAITLFLITFYLFADLQLTKQLYEPQRKLMLLQVLFRHGHRTPFSIYPNDPIPQSYWIEGLKQLTMLGRVQHYAVGRYLRERYEDFVTSNPREVHCLSSGAQRCRFGAYSLLAGMYPPSPDRLIDDNLLWQPIPVEYRAETKDKYLQSTANCPTSDLEKKLMFTRPEGAAFIAKYKHLYDFWSNCSGQTIEDYDRAGSLYKTLLLQKTLNLTIPKWAEDTWQDLIVQGDMSYYFNFRTNITHRLRGGPLINRMLNNMRKKMGNPEHSKKVYLYSGHGSNVAAILQSLRLFNKKAPPYTAFVTLELYRGSGDLQQYTVRILYTNGTNPEVEVPPPNVLVLPGCTEYCPFEYWEQYTAHLIPEDYKAECGERVKRNRRRWQINDLI